MSWLLHFYWTGKEANSCFSALIDSGGIPAHIYIYLSY